MAIKQIDLVINTSRGEKNVRKLQQVAKQVERTFGNINKLKINIKTDPAQAALKRLNAQIEQGKMSVNSFMDTNRPNQFARKISTIKEEMSFVRKAFDDAVKATERQRAATTLLAGNFKALRLEATAFAMASGTDPKKTIGNVSARLKEIEAFPRTILAGNEAMSMLKRMQEMTIVGSEEFLKISKAIGRQLGINANIQSQAARAAKPFTAATAFVTQEQINALGGATLVPPSRRLPAAGQTSGTFAAQSTREFNAGRQVALRIEKQITEEVKKQEKVSTRTEEMRKREARRRLNNMRRIRNRRQGTMLGAGFPLLFGGGAGAVGGSLLGTMLAPKGQEFGAQILGSALGTVLERTLTKVKDIGLATQNIDLDSLEQSGIRVNAQLSKTVNQLKRIGDFEGARQQIAKEVAKQTGTRPDTMIDIGNQLNLLGSRFQELLTSASAALGIISVPFTFIITELVEGLTAVIKLFNLITSQIAGFVKDIIMQLERIPFFEKMFGRIKDQLDDINKGSRDLSVNFDNFKNDLLDQIRYNAEILSLGKERADKEKRIRDLVKEYGADKKDQIVALVNALEAIEQEVKQVEKLNALYKSIGQSIETGIVDAIQGAIEGTKTLGEVARSVFSQISRSLIQFGVNSLLGSIFPGSRFFARANGGPVNANKNYLVGERGPEMFVPNAGGRIVPNSDLGGSTNVVVNVDASGSSVQGDEQRGRELGRLISVAVQSELIQQKRPGGILS